ncbi:MAG: LamG domain-containing protein [Rhodoferax sp.]|uniref:LamG domain-containing protein n=1 Tax=Rhodoferax sp. TaxID=50421 RepID=UPI001400674A|nr:LamG domain-containing protein [Rhodoferax sp.]NDP40916.1 LamG domain-containing protein [Rhodoferax sp.]
MNKFWPHLPVRWGQWYRLLAPLLALGVCILAGQSVYAQTYAYRNDVFAYDTPSGSASTVTWHTTKPAPACTDYPNGDDDWADIAFPAGFTFTFGGVNYSGVRVYSNGISAFGIDGSGFHRDFTPQLLPAPAGSTYSGCPRAAPINTMLAYWIDIVAGTANSTSGAAVKYELLGTAPNRRFVISWVNVKLYNSNTRYNFQISLSQSTAGVNGDFRYQYTSGSSNGSNATVGVQLTQTDYTQYSYNQQFIDTTKGTAILWYPANQLATKMAEYRFDESAWTGTAGQVKDTSGNNFDASRAGAAANVPDGKLCRGGSFTNNTSSGTIHAVETPIVPGNEGSLDFWYYANEKWDTANTMLFDASAVANRPFFLMKRSDGALRFVVTDSAGTSVTANSPTKNFAANTWHHVGVAWSVRVGTNQTAVQIFLDGVLQNGAPTRGTTNGSLPALNTIYIGDNRTSGVTPANGTGNGADGILDEVYVYPIEISAPQVMADMNLTRPTCTTLDHFHIVHDGAVSNCSSPANITIEAHDADHALFSLAGTTLNLSTDLGRGTWSNVAGGAINSLTAIGVGTGTASYTFSGESSVTFGLSHKLSEALNINVGSGGITEHTGTAATCVAADITFPGGSCDVSRTFVCAKPFGFNCVESGAAALNGHLYTKLAGTAFSVDVVALKDANSDGVADAVETAYASDADKSVTVELVDGSGVTACSARAAISPAVSQTLTFSKVSQPTELGRKSTAAMAVDKAYADLRCRVTDANLSPTIVNCSSDAFAVRPAQFTVTAPVMTNAALTDTPKAVAGSTFTLTASAGVATGYTGTPVLDSSKVNDHFNNAIAAGTLSGTFAAGTIKQLLFCKFPKFSFGCW